MPSDPVAQVSEDEAGRQAFAALLRERIPGYPNRGSLEAFALRCGGRITGPQVGQYCRGEYSPRMETVRLLCKGMGIPLIYGLSVLAGIEPVEKAPRPDDLHELSEYINRANDLMNRLVVRSANEAHAERRRSRPRTNHDNAEADESTSGSIDRNINSKMDYDHQELDAMYRRNRRVRQRELVA